MEAIIAVSIAVAGWIANHLLTIQAQKKSFINELKNTARSEIVSSLRNYHESLVNLGRAKGRLDHLLLSLEVIGSIPVRDDLIVNFIKLCSEPNMTLIPNARTIIEEYETLFPQTAAVRIYLYKKHVGIFYDFKEAANQLKKTMSSVSYRQLETILGKIDRFGIPAQLWIVKDFLVCIQNLSLGEITGKTVIQKRLTGEIPEVKHPRLIMDSKNNIIITKSKYSSNQKEN
jgi:hypothetical protein